MNNSDTESVRTGFVLLLPNGEYVRETEGLGHLGTGVDRRSVKALNKATIFNESQLTPGRISPITRQLGRVIKVPAYEVRTVALGTHDGNGVSNELE